MRSRRFSCAVLVFLGAALITCPAAVATPEVTNVLAVQRPGTKLVDVTYDLYDADGHAMTVALYISPDGGVSFPIHCLTVSGDVGAGVMSGTGRQIEWDAGVEYPGHPVTIAVTGPIGAPQAREPRNSFSWNRLLY